MLYEQELATAAKAMTVAKFLKGVGRDLKTDIAVSQLSLFVIE